MLYLLPYSCRWVQRPVTADGKGATNNVVIGDWRLSREQDDEQGAGLSRIVSGVARLPGLAKGYWTISDDGTRSST